MELTEILVVDSRLVQLSDMQKELAAVTLTQGQVGCNNADFLLKNQNRPASVPYHSIPFCSVPFPFSFCFVLLRSVSFRFIFAGREGVGLCAG